MLTVLIFILLALSVAFCVLTLLGLHEPRLGLAHSRLQSLRRNGLIALTAFILFAIALSVQTIDRRGYDARFAFSTSQTIQSNSTPNMNSMPTPQHS